MSQPEDLGAASPNDTVSAEDTVLPAESLSPEDTGPPEIASAVFGAAMGCALAYASILATRGVEWGVIGPREVPRLWDRHLLNCAVLSELVDADCATLADIGSGAGLPGVVLAMLLPKVDITLVEPLERRARFLTECVSELGLGNATVLRGRAEDLAGQVRADVVTARAVAPLERLVPLTLGMVRRRGMVLAVKGSGAAEELRQAQPVLRRLGARSAEVLSAGHGKVEPATTVVRFFAR
jgi:16S rRNA (guanine527-N7)-methyltransferase